MPAEHPPIVAELEVTDFRSVQGLSVELGPVCALVGEAQSGKSNVLGALRAVLDPAAAAPDDVRSGADGLHVRARVGDAWLEVTGRPPDLRANGGAHRPPVLFLPASERADGVIAPHGADGIAGFEEHLARRLRRRDGTSRTLPALAAVDALDACIRRHVRGVLLLVEEPELYLRPQAQRYFARLLRRFAALGNQVVFSTHAPAFLNVARMDELVFVERRQSAGTKALRPDAFAPDEDFRVLSEFDAERAELFLARAAILVEGETEKLALPFVFAALGEDADREGISIVECGGKGNIILFARVCQAAGVPFVIVHDRDAPPHRQPSATDRATHARFREIAGEGRTIELAPDFEAIAHLRGGGSHKPERAWRNFARLTRDRMPGELVRACRLALDLARR